MFCANCGAADQSTNSYCRRCGRYLHDPSPWRRRDSPERAALWLAVVSVPAFLFCIGVMVIIFRITVYGGSPAYLVASYGLCGGVAGFAAGCFFYGLRLRRRFINAREPAGGRGGVLSPPDAGTAPLPLPEGGQEGPTALLDAEPGRASGTRRPA